MGLRRRRYTPTPNPIHLNASGGTVVRTFSSVAEILECISRVDETHCSVFMETDHRFIPFTWAEAVGMLKRGWPEGIREIAFNTDKINDAIDEASGYGIEYDTSGDYIDIGAFLEGTPECFGKVVTAEGPKDTINIIVSSSACCNVDQREITNRGAAICALVDQLRKTHFVTLDVTIDVDHMEDRNMRTTFHLDMENGYSRDLLAFYLANPAMLRRIWFSIAEVALGVKNCGGYGAPRFARNGEKGAICFPTVESGKWDSIEKATKEVQAILDRVVSSQAK